MIKGQTIREIRFRDGYIIPRGDTLLINWPDAKARPGEVEIHHREKLLSGRASTSLAWIGLTISEGELEVGLSDGVCETPAGNTVEPDGIDPQGNPSWLRIHGLI
jgi:hypothetical protein